MSFTSLWRSVVTENSELLLGDVISGRLNADAGRQQWDAARAGAPEIAVWALAPTQISVRSIVGGRQ